MATKKVTQLATATSADAADLVMIVDVTDTAMSPEGTNKQITKANLLTGVAGLLTQVETAVINAEVIHMKHDDEPVELVAAQVGKIIVPVNFTVVSTAAGIAEASSDDLRFGWSAATSGSTDYINGMRDFMDGITGGAINTTIFSPLNTSMTTIFPASAENKPLEAWCNDQFEGGWSMVIYTTYYTITT